MKRVLALDFDGLLCDSLAEGVLTTWNGYYEKGLAAFSNAGFAAIPARFIERFTFCRGFARHSGHFFAAFLDPWLPMCSQRDFERVYQAISAHDVHSFVEKVACYRERVRQKRLPTWLSYHHLYPGIARFLSVLTLPTYIVTAKDAASVAMILEYAGIPFAADHIVGSQQEKIGALQTIQQREAIRAADLFFFDDHLPNILTARQAGYTAFWALWGYNVPDHFALAQEQRIPTIDLSTFLSANPVFSYPPFFPLEKRASAGKYASEEDRPLLADFSLHRE